MTLTDNQNRDTILSARVAQAQGRSNEGALVGLLWSCCGAGGAVGLPRGCCCGAAVARLWDGCGTAVRLLWGRRGAAAGLLLWRGRMWSCCGCSGAAVGLPRGCCCGAAVALRSCGLRWGCFGCWSGLLGDCCALRWNGASRCGAAVCGVAVGPLWAAVGMPRSCCEPPYTFSGVCPHYYELAKMVISQTWRTAFDRPHKKAAINR